MLNRDAVSRALPAILQRLGSENRRNLLALNDCLNEDGRANLGELLDLLYPDLDAQSGQAKLRQLRLAIAKAAAKPPAIIFALEGDTQTRSLPQQRWVWFSGEDPLSQLQAASVGEALPGWIDIDAEPLDATHCHVLYAKKDEVDALKLVELLQPHFAAKGLDLWTRREILPGQNLEDETRRSEENCLFALALISPEFRADPACQAASARLGRRAIPISLYNTGKDGETQLFRHADKSFGDVRNKRNWALHLNQSLEPILESKGRIRLALPAPDLDFVPGEAEPISLERNALSDEGLTNLALRNARGRSAVDSLLQWASDPEAQPYCALLGELGMGKTTTVKELTRRIQGRIPIYLDLRNVRELAKSGDDCPGLRAILASILEKQVWEGGPGVRPPTVDDVIQLAARGALIIFDGLDEVLVNISPERGQLFTRQLFSIIPARRNIPGRLLITCRSHYFRTLAEQSAHFTTEDRDVVTAKSYAAFVLLPFREAQIREYLNSTLGETEGLRAFELISTVHNLPELAERPYTLSLIRKQFNRLEQEKAAGRRVTGIKLYRFFVEEWLVRDTGKHQFRPDDKQLLMEELAAELVRVGQRSWSARQLEQWLATLVQHHPVFRTHIYSNVASALLEQDLRNATFLVREGNNFRFAHSSLQEYFVACHFSRSLQQGLTEKLAIPKVSRETLDFLGQLLQELDETTLGTVQNAFKQIRSKYYPQASEQAFEYLLHAHEMAFPKVALAGFDLPGINLRDRRIGNLSREPLNLIAINLTGANLRGSRWQRCQMEDAIFEGVQATNAAFESCRLQGSRWKDADLAGVIFRRSRLENTDFNGADLHRTRLPNGKSAVELALKWRRMGIDRGHKDRVSSSSFSSDGRLIVSGSWDKEIRIWDSRTGDCLQTLRGHQQYVTSCSFSLDGRYLVSSSYGTTVHIWDVGTGECLQLLIGHEAAVLNCKFSPDGRWVVSGSKDNTLRIWDAATGQCLHKLKGHADAVTSCSFSLDQCWIVSGSADKSVRLWDAQSGRCLHTLLGHEDTIFSCSISSDSSLVISGSGVRDRSVRLWDAQTGECLRKFWGHEDMVSSCCFSANNRFVVSGSLDRTVRLWDVSTGEVRQMLHGDFDTVHSCDISGNGNWVVSGSVHGTVRVWDATTGECLRRLRGRQAKVANCAMSADGRWVISGSTENDLRLWDGRTGECRVTLRGDHSYLVKCEISADGCWAIASFHDGTLRLWDAQTGEFLRTLGGKSHPVIGLGISADGRWLVTSAWDNSLRLWDAQTGECRQMHLDQSEVAISCNLSADGRWAVSGSVTGTVQMWDAKTGQCIMTLRGHEHQVNDCSISNDGCWLISCSSDKTLRLWSALTGECLQILKGHEEEVISCDLSANGGLVVSGSGDKTVRLWDAKTGKCLQTIHGHEATVTSCGITANCLSVISGSLDGTVRLWNAETGEEVGPRLEHFEEEAWASIDPKTLNVLHRSDNAWRYLNWLCQNQETKEWDAIPEETLCPEVAQIPT